MHVIVADAMQELQVAEPVILVVPALMVDCCVLLHGEEQSAMHTSSALMLEEFSSGCVQSDIIGKYLSRLRKFDQVIALQERFEAQLQAPRLSITFGMSALGMTRQIRNGHFQRVIEPCDVPGLQGLDNPA